MPFNIIVAFDSKFGIGKNNTLPWKFPEDLKYFKELTVNSTVIMGRKTFESLLNPLPQRENIVVTSKNINNIKTFSSLNSALEYSKDKKVFIIGGSLLFREALSRFLHLCDKIYFTKIPGDFNCDTFFPYPELLNNKVLIRTVEPLDFYSAKIDFQHPEENYLSLLRRLLSLKNNREDRTGIKTKSLFSEVLSFDLRRGFPLFTTKKVFFKGIVEELLFFLSGKTDTKLLENKGIFIWKGNTSQEFLKKRNLPWKEGDMGPGYGFQWRHWGSNYTGPGEYSGIDQIRNLIKNLREEPFSRRHILSSWNVSDIDKMALPPCHLMFQCYIEPPYIDGLLMLRSSDVFLGLPFNVASYALLLSILGYYAGYIPRILNIQIGDAHLYLNHLEEARLQAERSCYPFGKIEIDFPEDFELLKMENIKIKEYQSHPAIKVEMCV